MFPDNLNRLLKRQKNKGFQGVTASNTREWRGGAEPTSLLRIHALICVVETSIFATSLDPREADSHIPLPHSLCKDGSTPLLLSGKVPASIHIAIATQEKHHASSHFADLDRPAYLGPSPS